MLKTFNKIILILWIISFANIIQIAQGNADTDATNSPAKNRCQLIVPNNSNVFRLSSDESSKLENGTNILINESISIKCNNNYIIQGKKSIVCLGDKWNHEMPYCERVCSSKTFNDVSLNVSCEYLGNVTSCQEPLLSTTIAKITCAFGYRLTEPPGGDYNIKCIDGVWNSQVVKCEPICGEQPLNGIPGVIDERVKYNTLVPWHVGIYSDVNEPNNFIQICSGTIVTTKLIVSAANCFWDLANNQFHDSSHFMIATGKYYSDYNDSNEPLLVQKIPVLSIEHELGYKDYSGFYLNDIAVLILSQHIILRAYVVPICIEYDVDLSATHIVGGQMGMVAGWKFTKSTENSTKVLKVIDLPTIDLNTCKSELPAGSIRFLTNDKFCAKFPNQGEHVCDGSDSGDGGGGFVIPDKMNDRNIYYLHGIISSAVRTQGTCTENNYTIIFTNVNLFTNMIQNANIKSRSYE